MECPVAMVDHDSALVGADWYEEQGNQIAADQIRQYHQLASIRSDLLKWHKISHHTTSQVDQESISWNSKRTDIAHVSLCRTGRRRYHTSQSMSTTGRNRRRR